jgi:pimeloyl-ACP methyl ester carboxylesterase
METPPTPLNLLAEAGQTTYHSIELADKTMLQYAVALPDGFDPSQPYPILLALPPGGQDRAMVEAGLDRYWARLAEQRGWIVLSPIAPNGVFFFQGSERLIPEFLERTAEQYRPEGGKYHLAGISNGGLSGFRIALNNPNMFHSLTVLPGFPPTEVDSQNLAVLKDIPVTMFVGQEDTAWAQAMQRAQQELTRLGGQASLEIIPDEGHVIQSLTRGEKLFDLLDSFRRQ